MAWNPNKPQLSDLIIDSIADIRGNFQEIDGLPQVKDSLINSRIVDHNLDVMNPPNGYYVRLQNGLQLCWTGIIGWGQQEGNKGDDIWVFPAAFKERPYVVGFPESLNEYPVHFWIRQIRGGGNHIHFNAIQVPISRYRLGAPNNYETVHLLAIGRWK